MTYEELSKVNDSIKTVDIKGKEYAQVPERVAAFRKLFPMGFIKTDIISADAKSVIVKAEVGIYTDTGAEQILGTGLAQEYEGNGFINERSFVENCETSAVGRALGFLGLIGASSIATAEEVQNAQEPKYNKPTKVQEKPKTIPEPKQYVPICANCNKEIVAVKDKEGNEIPAMQIADIGKKRFANDKNWKNKSLCASCQTELMTMLGMK